MQTVLDVGTGSGILAIWSAQAGARKVYAVEATDMATHARALVAGNKMENVVEVIEGSVEDISLPEQGIPPIPVVLARNSACLTIAVVAHGENHGIAFLVPCYLEVHDSRMWSNKSEGVFKSSNPHMYMRTMQSGGCFVQAYKTSPATHG